MNAWVSAASLGSLCYQEVEGACDRQDCFVGLFAPSLGPKLAAVALPAGCSGGQKAGGI